MLDPEIYHRVIYDWNQTTIDYPSDKTIHQLFEEQVVRTPDNVAVIYEDRALTYQELNQKSNQLAHYIKERYQIQGDDLIILCLDRSEQMLISVLAVLKSGGAYVPIDPNYPEDRISHILRDTKAAVVLSHAIHCEKLHKIVAREKLHTVIEAIDGDEIQCQLHHESMSNLNANVTTGHLAYVIYTSGTTGQPKGVMLEHQGIVNRLSWMNHMYPLQPKDRVLQKTPYVFDVSVWELLWASLYGASTVFAKPEAHKAPRYLLETIQAQQITVIHFVPSMLDVFNYTLSAQTKRYDLSRLRYVFCSGEALSLNQAKMSCELLPNVALHNLYGPTEASIDVLYYDCSIKPLNRICIGKPIANTTAYILNDHLMPLPLGAIGELYIGGVGLARGYLNLPALTAKKFITNPFQTVDEQQRNKNSRLYKTGDLVRYLDDGNIEYIGRNDFQVKIRGFRVELGEIESKLRSFPKIRQAVALIREQQCRSKKESSHHILATNKYLLGYYVSDEPLEEEAVFRYLASVLPDYMLPDFLIHLDQLPLTLNGKLDRNALPDLELSDKKTYVAPKSDLEQKICTIYADVLNLDQAHVGIYDDFFRLGGNSIRAIQASNKISTILRLQFGVADVFRLKTVHAIAHHMATVTIQNIHIPTAETRSDYPLSFSQERLWFIEQYEQGTNAYHIPILIRLKNTVKIDGLIWALRAIVSRHEVLRSVFTKNTDGIDCQVVQDTLLDIKQVVCTCEKEYQTFLAKDINQPFDLRSQYPIRVVLYHLNKKKGTSPRYDLLLNFHHVVSDDWSIEIFKRELLEYYEHYVLGKALTLTTLPIQYKDFATWQHQYLLGETFANQLNYWQKRLSGYETLSIATDKLRPLKVSYIGAEVHFNLGIELSTQLRALSKDNGYTLYTVLLSGFYLLLYQYSGQTDITVGSPTANRHYAQTQDLIGFFVNMLVQREQLDVDQSIFVLFEQVHQHLSEAQRYQDLPFEKLVEELKVERDASRHPLFQITFTVESFDKALAKHLNKIGKIEDISNIHSVTRFDLECFMDDSETEISGKLLYSSSLYEHATISRMVHHYKNILEQIVTEQEKALKDYQTMSATEYHEIVYNWNKTDKNYPNNKMIHQLFEEQTAKTPENIAIAYENNALTYQALNRRAEQLARYIRETYHIKGDDLIALCLERSEHMLIAILAILKSGAAYVPIDPSYPDGRIIHILKDTQAKVLLSNERHYHALSVMMTQEKLSTHVEQIDSIPFQNKLRQYTNSPLNSQTNSKNLAYVIYTSGTTGQPKGVMLTHENVTNYIENIKDHHLITDQDTVDFSTNISFDLTVTTTLCSLAIGAKIAIYFGVAQDIEKYLSYLLKHQISVIKLVPSYFKLLIEDLPKTGIKKIILGGEKLSMDIFHHLDRVYKNIALLPDVYDEYGPTEATVGTCIHKINWKHHFTIGKPYQNYTIYVLSEHLHPLPIGAIGELYIGGVGLARGYLNQPELTAEKFINNPFQSEDEKIQNKNNRLYKTGDLARYFPNGDIEYIGRHDGQVKIRGFRIELGEIENQLRAIHGVKQAVVVAKERVTDTQTAYQNLVAYYVLNHEIIVDNDNAILMDWENLYDSLYREVTINTPDVETHFDGWTSFVTSQPIPYAEMEAWRHATLQTIKSLNPQRVMEIGIGSGLIMYPLLKDVRSYVGLDISSGIIAKHHEYLKNTDYKVELYHLTADQIDRIQTEQRFDCIIFNSVIQYFPSIKYFEDVLTKALKLLNPGGSLFIGDIRDYHQHRNLIRDRLIYEQGGGTEAEIDILAKRETELLIAPEYFLERQNDQLTVMILAKTGDYSNELNQYRYDVILSLKAADISGLEVIPYPSIQTKRAHNQSQYNIPLPNKLSPAHLFEILGEQLPQYMMPDYLIELEHLPLTMNGKLDHRALPDPVLANQDIYVAPRNELEQQVCMIYAAVLGLSAEKVGIHDDFFSLGGNSIQAITLVSKLNKHLAIHLKIADVFIHKSVESISKIISQDKEYDDIFIELNLPNDKPPLFMIHPGGGGCEVYSSLADKLNSSYMCYGIDNYNLYHEKKYLTSHSLAGYYLKVIQHSGKLGHKSEEILLLGWSLGGLIALEIAGLLEQQGYLKIKVYLLDTTIDDDQLKEICSKLSHETMKQKLQAHLLNHEYESGYIQKLVDNYDTENSIHATGYSGNTLYNTQVILFKAMKKDMQIEPMISDLFHRYMIKLPYNNIETAVHHLSQIHLINLHDVSHADIVEHSEIVKVLLHL